MDTRSLFRRLQDEWATVGSGPAARDAVSAWARAHPEFIPFDDLAEVVERCHERGDPAAANRLLAAVLVLAESDGLARRTLLQALLPGLAALARRAQRKGWCGAGAVWGTLGELDQELLALACERIRALGGQQLVWPAATLVDQVWRRARTAAEQHRARTDRQLALNPERLEEAGGAYSTPWEQQLTQLVRDAVREGLVARTDAAVIVRTRVLGVPPAEVAAQLQVDVRALWQRRRRAEHTLAAAWLAAA